MVGQNPGGWERVFFLGRRPADGSTHTPCGDSLPPWPHQRRTGLRRLCRTINHNFGDVYKSLKNGRICENCRNCKCPHGFTFNFSWAFRRGAARNLLEKFGSLTSSFFLSILAMFYVNSNHGTFMSTKNRTWFSLNSTDGKLAFW